MSHAYSIPPLRPEPRRTRCPECKGWDVGAVGFIHHFPGCSSRKDAVERERDHALERRLEQEQRDAG